MNLLVRTGAAKLARMAASKISAEQFTQLLEETIPLTHMFGLRIDRLEYGVAHLTLPADPRWVRPGGTLAGPAVMTLADTAVYAAVLSCIGLVPMAVTSDLSVRFLRRAAPTDLHAEARALRVGRRQAVCEVRMWSDDPEQIVAHATSTYALPA